MDPSASPMSVGAVEMEEVRLPHLSAQAPSQRTLHTTGVAEAVHRYGQSASTENDEELMILCIPLPGRLVAAFGVMFPWVFSVFLGIVTAFTGAYIGITCDFFSDMRMGSCQGGAALADRGRCCGGADNVDFFHERCEAPQIADDGYAEVQWVSWEEQRGSSVAAFALYLAGTLLLSGCAAFLVHRYSPSARGSGIPEVKAAVSGFYLPQSFTRQCLLVKTLGLALGVGAGLSLGKEGPLIHIGVCWAYALAAFVNWLGVFGEALPLHELGCIGAAAGVSTAFGAPVGGVLFAVEELGSVRPLSKRALILSFASAFAASFTLKWLNFSGANKLTLFALSTPTSSAKKEWMTWEMIPFVFLGVVGGLVGAAFIRMNLAVARRRKKRKQYGHLWMFPEALQMRVIAKLPTFLKRLLCGPPERIGKECTGLSAVATSVVEVLLVAFVTACTNFMIAKLLRINQTEAIHALFEICPHGRTSSLGLCDDKQHHGHALTSKVFFVLIISSMVRLWQTTITFGVALPSGLFIPSLFIGACLGRAVGMLMLILNLHFIAAGQKSHVDPGVFAMVGALAVLGGFSRMTVSLVVIMFELTGELTYIVPFMCAVLAAKVVGDYFTVSIYDGFGTLNGYAMIEEPEDIRLEAMAADLMEPVIEVLDASTEVEIGRLKSLLRGDDRDAEDGAAKDRSNGPGVLLLAAMSQPPETLAVVEKEPLEEWLQELEGCSDSTYVSFGNASGLRDRAEAARVGGQSSKKNKPARLPKDEGLGVDGRSFITTERNVVDASELVEVSIVRLNTSAPLLTAWCSFTEYPELRYCVVRNEQSSFGVLERRRFYEALEQDRYALSHTSKATEKQQEDTKWLVDALVGVQQRYLRMGDGAGDVPSSPAATAVGATSSET